MPEIKFDVFYFCSFVEDYINNQKVKKEKTNIKDVNKSCCSQVSILRKYFQFMKNEKKMERINESYFEEDDILETLDNFLLFLMADSTKRKESKLKVTLGLIYFFKWCYETDSVSMTAKRKNNIKGMIESCQNTHQKIRSSKEVV